MAAIGVAAIAIANIVRCGRRRSLPPSLAIAQAANAVVPEDVGDKAVGDKTAAAPAASSIELPATDDGIPGAGPIRRYDWFRNLWTQKRSAWAKRVEQDAGAVVFLGDSITQGWGDDLAARSPD
jgi:hypothetical protein